MELGIFAKTFQRPTLEKVLDAVDKHGIKHIQFNMACVGLPSMPESIDDAVIEQVRRAVEARDMTMVALSGTFNMIHPDMVERQTGLRSLEVLARAAQPMGVDIITLCTGTRDPDDKWKHHPDNNTEEAWRDLTVSMHRALQIAEDHDVTLAIESETGNVINSAAKARRLLDLMGSHRLGVIMDGANLFYEEDIPRMGDILDEAFDLIGGDVVLAHAKELNAQGEFGDLAAGSGVLDYDQYIMHLRKIGYTGALVMHGLREDQVEQSVGFLREKLAKIS